MGIEISELNARAARISELRAEEARIGNERKIVTQELELKEREFMECLQAEGMTSFRSPVGLLSISFRTSVQTPKTAEDRTAFFDYLREKDLYDSMITVNSQTLNSFYKSELELASERGLEDFQIPGINNVTVTPNLSFRK